jgi:cell division protein ZapA (FtsZ GTPase activity inhibitor)
MNRDNDRWIAIQVADAVKPLRDDMAQLRDMQRNLLTGFNLMLDTLGAQTEMLAEILSAARQEQGPSEVAKALEQLTAAVQQNNETIEALGTVLTTLPGEIGAEIVRAGTAQPTHATPS